MNIKKTLNTMIHEPFGWFILNYKLAILEQNLCYGNTLSI